MPEVHDERVDRLLCDAFAGTSKPTLSLRFDRRLRAAVAEEHRRQRAARIRARIMVSYWVASGLIASSMMASLSWSRFATGGWLPLAIAAAVLVVPIRLVRADLIGLVLGSVKHLRRSS